MDDPGSISQIMAEYLGRNFMAGAIFNDIFFDIIIILILIAINAFFSASELSIISLNDNKIKKKAEEGDEQAKRLLKLTESPSEFLATVQVGVTLAGFLSSAFAADKFAFRLTQLINPAPAYERLVQTGTVVFLTLILAYFSLVFGELVPKRLAMRSSEKIARKFVIIISFFDKILRPITRFLGFSTNLVLKIFKTPIDISENSVTEEEIRMMIDVGREEGSIHLTEKEMIENIFEFNDKEVSEIMTHRTNVTALEVNEEFENVMEIFMSEQFSRLPVYEDTLDNIIGILHIKDVIPYCLNKGKLNFKIRDLMRPVYVTPETKTIDSLFREMQKDRVQLAVVIDEYGGTSGIITVEDLLEEIVGNIQDEYDEELLPVQKQADNVWIIDGRCEIDELKKLIPEIKMSFQDDYDTVAGLVIHLLDRIPESNEKAMVTEGNLQFEVLEMDEKRIAKLKLTILPNEENLSKENNLE